jgi:hypothetical protein
MDDFEDFLNATPFKAKIEGSNSATPPDELSPSASKNCFTLDDEDDFLSDTNPITPIQAKYTPDDDGFDDLFNIDLPKVAGSILAESQDVNILDNISENVVDMGSNIDFKIVKDNDKDDKIATIRLITAVSHVADILDSGTENVVDTGSNVDFKIAEDNDEDEKIANTEFVTAEPYVADILENVVESIANAESSTDFEIAEDNDKDEKPSNISLTTVQSQAADILDDIIGSAADLESNMNFVVEDNDKDEKVPNIGLKTAELYVGDILENVIESAVITESNIKLEAEVININCDDLKGSTEHSKSDIESELVADNEEIVSDELILKDNNVDEKIFNSNIFDNKIIVTPVKPEGINILGENNNNIVSSKVITTPQTPYSDDYEELFGSPSVISSSIKDPVNDTKGTITEKTEELSLNSVPVTPKKSDDDDDFMSWLGDSTPTPSKPPTTPALGMFIKYLY